MATGDVVKLGTLYSDRVKLLNPTNPKDNGNIPRHGINDIIEIRDTDNDDAYKIKWREINDGGKKYLVSDRVILSAVSWDNLNTQSLILGKIITIDGKQYRVRVMSGGSNYRNISNPTWGGSPSDNEWDRWILNQANLVGLPTPTDDEYSGANRVGVHNQFWNWSYIESWSQETYTGNSSERAVRGGTGAGSWRNANSSLNNSGYGWRPVLEVLNAPPTVTVTSPTANQTLYENDTLSIAGTTSDSDSGNTVTVRYQINATTVRAIDAFLSNGVAKAFSKQLRFSGGNLYDDGTLIASGLVDGVAHKLKVWATDDQGGTSTSIERDFYVVPNRAPLLTVNPPDTNGIIDSDKLTIAGTYEDADNNQTTVKYRINGGNSVQVASGTGGSFDFEITFGQLQVGLNNIVVEAIDSYGAKTSRTVKLQKNEVKTEQLKSTARYKILPPLNTATGVVIWVRRDENLALTAAISMTQAGEAESFAQMTKAVTAPVPNSKIVEDQFQYENTVATDTIILQLDMERSSLTASEKIHVLVGVID